MSMAVPVLKRKQDVGTWVGTFPEVISTQEQSVAFVKKMVAISISEILYLKSLFPKHAFKDREVEGVKLKILRTDKAFPGSNEITDWVKGCYDALDKKFLKQTSLIFYEEAKPTNKIIEMYSFKFDFNRDSFEISNDKGKFSTEITSKEIRETTLKLIKSIVSVVGNVKPFNQKTHMTMKLLYFDEITPQDYEPPGFRPCSSNTFKFENEFSAYSLGKVLTNHHEVKVKMKLEEENHGKELSKDDQCMMDYSSSQNVTEVKENEKRCEIPCSNPTSQPCTYINEMSQEEEINCPCTCKQKDDLMLYCFECCKVQHAVCYGILSKSDIPSEHLCIQCLLNNSNTKNEVSRYFRGYQPNKPSSFQMISLARRIMCYSLKKKEIKIAEIVSNVDAGVEKVKCILNKLEKEKFGKVGRGLFIADRKEIYTNSVSNYFDLSRIRKFIHEENERGCEFKKKKLTHKRKDNSNDGTREVKNKKKKESEGKSRTKIGKFI